MRKVLLAISCSSDPHRHVFFVLPNHILLHFSSTSFTETIHISLHTPPFTHGKESGIGCVTLHQPGTSLKPLIRSNWASQRLSSTNSSMAQRVVCGDVYFKSKRHRYLWHICLVYSLRSFSHVIRIWPTPTQSEARPSEGEGEWDD